MGTEGGGGAWVVGEGAGDDLLLATGQFLAVETEGGGVDQVGEDLHCPQPVLGVEGEWVACTVENVTVHNTIQQYRHLQCMIYFMLSFYLPPVGCIMYMYTRIHVAFVFIPFCFWLGIYYCLFLSLSLSLSLYLYLYHVLYV